MARPIRLQFPGSLHHVTTRGTEKRLTFLDDRDRLEFLEVLGEAVRRFNWILTTYVLMSNHFHLLIQLTEENLSRGMQWLNGKYAKWFNRVHDRVGHLVQEPFDSRLVEKETYFLNVHRYVVLNPVRAKMVARPENYEWSSYRAIVGEVEAPKWLAVDDVLIAFAPDRGIARAFYKDFMTRGIGDSYCPWDDAVGDTFLGTQAWLEKVRDQVALKPRSSDHPFEQRRNRDLTMSDVIGVVSSTLGISELEIRHGRDSGPRGVAAWVARYEANLLNTQISAALRLRSSSRVTKLVADCDEKLTTDVALRTEVDRCIATLRRESEK